MDKERLEEDRVRAGKEPHCKEGGQWGQLGGKGQLQLGPQGPEGKAHLLLQEQGGKDLLDPDCAHNLAELGGLLDLEGVAQGQLGAFGGTDFGVAALEGTLELVDYHHIDNCCPCCNHHCFCCFEIFL